MGKLVEPTTRIDCAQLGVGHIEIQPAAIFEVERQEIHEAPTKEARIIQRPNRPFYVRQCGDGRSAGHRLHRLLHRSKRVLGAYRIFGSLFREVTYA